MTKEDSKKIDEMHTVLLGVKGTEDTGVVGQIKDIADQVKETNGCVRTNTAWRKAHTWLIGIAITVIIIVVTQLL